MEIVISIAAKISKYLVEPVVRPAGYLIFYNRNVSALNTQVEELGHFRSRVQHEVDEARWNGELLHDDVGSWLTNVNEINGQVEMFQNEVKGNKGCLGGWCPNPISRYSLSRKAKKTTEAVNELKAKGSFPSVSYSPPPPGFVYKATEGFADFESRKLIMKDIMAALEDYNIHSIGICGLGGVGKTTTVKEVGSRAKAEKLCDAITMAVVSQTPDLKKIQGAIADMLGLELKREESPSGRADRLRARLMDGTRILVILDDVWERLDLEAVGIPFGGDRKGCRVMITSRNEEVCKFMKTCKNFRIGVLSEPEAWKLFKEMAGNSIESDNDLNPIAQEVVKECGGLPIAIVTVGRALENEAKHTWKDALRQLKMPRPENIPEILKEVYGQLELSYNSLKTQDAKSCLLFCCMFPEDAYIRVEWLVTYGMGLGWFEGIDALADARNRVRTLVDQLKRCFLLLDSEFQEEYCVRMHDVIRDVIRHIATTEGRGNQYAIPSLMSGSEINELPDRLDCPKLELLLMVIEDNVFQKVWYTHLFEGMKELRVLLVHNETLIPSSVSSLSFLTKLRSLDLCDCELENISAIGELQTLITLSFNGSSIEELPQEIGKLTRLRLLDLTACNLKIVSPSVISRLVQLEELYLLESGLEWVVEGEGKGKNELNLSELVSLPNLIALETHLPTAKFPRKINILFEKLERFGIHIGTDEDQWRHKKRLRNKLILELDTRISVDSGIHVLLKKTKTLRLQLKGVESILNLTRENLVQLKSLKLDSSEGLEYLIDTVDLIPHSIFPILESLKLRYMLNLKMLCHGQLPSGSFEKLRHIEVADCRVLKSLFSQSIARGLVGLEVLKINWCKMIEEIVATERGEHADVTNIIRFPKLRELTLGNLQSIIGFCTKMDEIEFPQLGTLYLKNLPNFRSFCPNSLASKGNHGTSTQHLFNEKVMSLCELRSMEVHSCNNLLNVFSSNLVQSLQNLEKLEVENCDMLELVFDFAGINIEEGHATSALTCLKNLKLVCLPKLTHLWKAPPQIQGFQSLLSVEVGDCRSLKNIFTPYIAKLLVKLEKLQVSACAITEIVGKDEEDGEENEEVTKGIVFPQLNHLGLENLPDLTSFGPESYTFKWPALKILSLNNANMKVFIPAFLSAQKQRTINVKSNEEQQIIYPSLEVLQLGGEDTVEWILDCQLPDESLRKLTVISLVKCNQLLVFPSNLLPRLPKLEKLTIEECDSLVEVFQGELCFQFLPKLKYIRVWMCNSLRNLFTPSTAKIAEQLQVLRISDCWTVTEIVAEDEGEGDEKAMDKIEFPELCRLRLEGLPNFVSFFPKVSNSTSNILKTENSKAMDVGSGEILPQDNLHTQIHHLFNERVAFPGLEDLFLDMMDLNEIWCGMDHEGIRGFQNLKYLRVWNCDSLRHVFYPSMARGLLHLEQLEIYKCQMMEEIVVKGENEKEDRMDTINIPQLKTLSLSELPNLTSFCQGLYAFDLPSLEDVIIRGCPKMKTFSFGSLSTPKLGGMRYCYKNKSFGMGDLNSTIQELFEGKELKENQEIAPHYSC